MIVHVILWDKSMAFNIEKWINTLKHEQMIDILRQHFQIVFLKNIW